jgi:hypothetical protein
VDVVEERIDPHHQNGRHKVKCRKLHDILDLALGYVKAKDEVEGHCEGKSDQSEPIKNPELAFVLDVGVDAELVGPRAQQTDEENHNKRELVHEEHRSEGLAPC